MDTHFERDMDFERNLTEAWGKFSRAWTGSDSHLVDLWGRRINNNLIPEARRRGYTERQINWLLAQSPDNHTDFIPKLPEQFPD